MGQALLRLVDKVPNYHQRMPGSYQDKNHGMEGPPGWGGGGEGGHPHPRGYNGGFHGNRFQNQGGYGQGPTPYTMGGYSGPMYGGGMMSHRGPRGQGYHHKH